jgi:diaminohydroxyphosphoribosylaminopyrimidine deaminase / 5-amino-6-(5-phosphoribosylamino)uracil reductase
VYMHRCLQLAALGGKAVQSNPLVGCVIVHKNQIIGEGYHAYFGGPHAEVVAINHAESQHANALDLFKSSSLYVNLEPCAHHGKTPPCANLILSKGFKRVVIGGKDPFVDVSGKGIEKLKNAGIDVEFLDLNGFVAELNLPFLNYHALQRPSITLKWAD